MNPEKGRYSGKRSLMKEIHEYFSKVEILTGTFVGNKVTLSRTDFAAGGTWLPFALKGNSF